MAVDALSLHRLSAKLDALGVPLAPALITRLGLTLFSSSVPASVRIGEGTRVGYGGVGVFIHPGTVIGRYCQIAQLVSIGGQGPMRGIVRIGDYVRIGTGARILGPVTIGDFAVIGANSVVVRDVPPGAVVFGVPARLALDPEDPVREYEHDTGHKVAAADRVAFGQRRPPSRRGHLRETGRNAVVPGSSHDPADGPSGPPLELVHPSDRSSP